MGAKTFGFIIIDKANIPIKEAYPLKVDIKGISGQGIYNGNGFAPPLISERLTDKKDIYPDNKDGRVFHVQYLGTKKDGENIVLIPRGHDTEPNMLEEVARIYWKTNKKNVNLELFTDRETCAGCDSLITKINLGLEQTEKQIKISPYLVMQGIFQTSTKDNPNRDNELVKPQNKNFYMKIN